MKKKTVKKEKVLHWTPKLSSSVPEKIHVAFLDHDKGPNLYASRTREGLVSQVYEYVNRWWSKEGMEGEIPDNPLEAIEMYFDNVDGEVLYMKEDVQLL